MTPRAETLTIETPEGVTFSYELAGMVRRAMAWLIDVLVVWGVLMALSIASTFLSALAPAVVNAVMMVLSVVIIFAYKIVLEWIWRGQTIGKRAMGIRVLDEHGLRLTLPQIVIRNLLRVLDSLPMAYLVGGIAAAVSRRSQRVGDFAAGTVVIRNPHGSQVDLSQALGGKYNSLMEYPHLVSRLRQRVSPQAAGVAMQALVRRDELDPQARVEVFSEMAELFRAAVDFPEEATEGLSDEQFVRNAIDAIFRAQK